MAAGLERDRNALGVGSVALASAGPLCLKGGPATRFGVLVQTLREGGSELARDEVAALLAER